MKTSVPRQSLQRVQWKQTLGYTFEYPYVLPPGFGGVPSVALDSKGNLWVFQRAERGKPQLFKFDPNHKLVRTIGEDVIGHQNKAHGMAIDADDNIWICDENGDVDYDTMSGFKAVKADGPIGCKFQFETILE